MKTAEPMSGETRADSVVICVRLRPRLTVYIRSYPKTGKHPTPAQTACRIAFGEAARKTRGVKYAEKKEGLPPAAEAVAKALRDLRFEPHKVKIPEWVKKISERLRLTEEERRALEERILELTRRT